MCLFFKSLFLVAFTIKDFQQMSYMCNRKVEQILKSSLVPFINHRAGEKRGRGKKESWSSKSLVHQRPDPDIELRVKVKHKGVEF